MSLPRRWLTEVLTAHGPQSPLALARAVWQAHEPEIRAAGDLLYTWQLDLHAAARALQTEGRLAMDGEGRWRLGDGTVGRSTPRAWSGEEIAVAVEAYVALLRAERTGTPLRRSDLLADVGARTGRTVAQVEAMMANVSAVVHEHGVAPLAAFPPRSNVPVGVRPAVAAALDG